MSRTVLHVLSQRPGRTGSGVTLDAITRAAAARGWRQSALVGVPADDGDVTVGPLAGEAIHTVRFGVPPVDFAVPGMSDVMPYTSTRFSAMTPEQLEAYRSTWRQRVAGAVADTAPDLIHVHHVWIVASLVRDAAADVPVVTHCHATGLRQMELCPHLADEVRSGCRRNDRFVVLHDGHRRQLADCLGVSDERIETVGAGFSEELFHSHGRPLHTPPRLVYVGKLSPAKGLGPLLDAFERLQTDRPGLELHVAGGGGGAEAEVLEQRMRGMTPPVVFHGPLAQPELADLLRTATVCVLPSFFEGLPLVLVEALACGCRLVATDIPSVRLALAKPLGAALDLVPPPRLHSIDVPVPADLPAFVDGLVRAIGRALDQPPLPTDAPWLQDALCRFTWDAVFDRIERVWEELLRRP